jgi:hypothetical protein
MIDVLVLATIFLVAALCFDAIGFVTSVRHKHRGTFVSGALFLLDATAYIVSLLPDSYRFGITIGYCVAALHALSIVIASGYTNSNRLPLLLFLSAVSYWIHLFLLANAP